MDNALTDLKQGHTPGPWLRVDTADYAEIHAAFRPSSQAVALVGKPADADLIAAAPELVEVLHEGRRAIGDHFAPNDCYATGPLTGDPIRDLVQCPACSFIAMHDAVLAKIGGAA